MGYEKGVIEQKDLDKHLPSIIGNIGLRNLTAEQIESIALMMETAYRKGLEHAQKKSISDQTINIKISSDIGTEKIKKAIEQSLNESFQTFINY